jgi:galactokinase
LNEAAEIDLDEPARTRRGNWLDYVEGIARSLEDRGIRLQGAGLAIESDIPIGAGLSSSAALEISVGLALLSISEIIIDRISLALAGQAAEHAYAGIKCGIMDQIVAALGRAGHALLIDCRSLQVSTVPINIPGIEIVICETGVKHSLASSEYNARRSECELGVKILGKAIPGISGLRDVTVEEFEKHEALLPEPVRRRCRHVITENARTLAAAEALRSGDLDSLGRLMAGSHRSLRDDFEVSCAELDLMVEIAASLEGVAGARMTGGGFGGCTVNLVRRESLDEFLKTVPLRYQSATNHFPALYVSEACDGAKEIA